MAELAEVVFSICWRDKFCEHRDRRFLSDVAFDQDTVAATSLGALQELAPGQSLVLAQGELLGPRQPTHLTSMPIGDWPPRIAGHALCPRRGRWYPAQVVAAKTASSAAIRIVGIAGGNLEIDCAPPLTGTSLTVEAEIISRRRANGPAARELLPLIAANGPGMQALPADYDCDFLDSDALTRGDEASDSKFYAHARLVDHLDATALAQLATLHSRFLATGQRVLDLMASANSHLPANAPAISMTGLGMNTEELAANLRLSERRVHDLNVDSSLPFADASFDLVLCALSVEYLVKPIDVFREVSRVLKPGGTFLVTFSERWFPPKAIKLWGELHPFERMGLVLHYFRRTGNFTNLHTESLRGLPRPPGDKYFRMTKQSDPIYAIWGNVVKVGAGDTPGSIPD